MRLLPVLLLVAIPAGPAAGERESQAERFLQLLSASPKERGEILAAVSRRWHNGLVPMTLEVWRFARNRGLRTALVGLLQKKTGQDLGSNLEGWFRWLWNRPIVPDSGYATFKSRLYRRIDPRFGRYFSRSRPTLIRLDEIRWGGVRQDGIPPLRKPRMVPAAQAKYLAGGDVVFGVEVNGDVRAYPKRILAWHEMFVDTIGGVPLAGVYCTLCGSMIAYETEVDGVRHELGTSGFLYRSNKLMYDRKTQSLWSTLEGKPVVGPLAKQGIRLRRRSVVTTTWAEWGGGVAATPTPGCSLGPPAIAATTPKAPPTATTSRPTD